MSRGHQGDRDFRQIGNDRQEYHAPKCFAQIKSDGHKIDQFGYSNSHPPDKGGGENEEDQEAESRIGLHAQSYQFLDE
jgi:hypothetical protein